MKRVIILLCSLLCMAKIGLGVEGGLLDQGDAAFNQGRYDEAIAAYRAVIRAEPSNGRAYFQVGRAYTAKGRYDEAIAAYQEGLQQKPDSALRHAIYQELGIIYGKKGRYDEAITALREATKLAPQDFHAHYALGAAYVQKGRYDEAITAFNEALRLAKTTPGGKDFAPLVEATLRDIQPKVPATPSATPAASEKFKLTVRAVPVDSTVKLENTKTQYHPGMEIAPGRYDLVVTREGYKPVRRTVTISNVDVTLDVALEQEKHKLTVQVTPADSTIKFDNSKLDYRPGLELPAGRYDLVVTRDGYKPARQQVTVTNADVTLNVALEVDKKYKLIVQTTPVDSIVKLDNGKVVYRPGLELPAGRYDLIVTHEGYKPARQQVVVSNADVTLDVALEADKKYKLTVQTAPADSTVKFDNSKLDYRPGLELPAGRYDLVVAREGYKPVRRTITVTNADVTLDVALEQEKHKLTVQTAPADSTVKFDNSKLDYRPGLELPAGRYDLVVAREGYKPARRQVTVSTADVTLKVTLELEKYKLTVQATPADSTVKLDNSKAKYQPGMEVTPGRYEVVVARKGYKPAHRTVMVSNADVTLDVALEQETQKLTVEATPADSTIKFADIKLDYRPGMELVPGRYDLMVTHDGYKPARRQVIVSTTDVTLKVALEPGKYKLTVQTTPADSTVKLANSKVEYRPGLELAPGSYDIAISREGYSPVHRTVVVSNADVTLDVALEPEKKYKLTVQAVPLDSTVKFDNGKLDYRPGLELAPGRYDLVVTHDGYKPARQQVTVSNGDVTLPVTLELEKYRLTVQTVPMNSTVKFDNSKLDYRPGLELAPGRYELVVAHDGYKPERRTVVVSNTDVTLDVTLDVIKYKLTVQAVPMGSTVKLANSKVEYRPGIEVEPGRYDLVVTHEGYKPARQQVTVSNADVTFPITLEPEKYKLTVQATPADSTVKFDNSKLDYRPGLELAPGRYDLVVTHEGYKPARRTVVVSNTDVTLDVALDVVKYKLTVQATPADSTVKFDNSKLDYRPGLELAPGRYDLVVTHEGYKPTRQQVTVSNGDVTLPITLELEKYKLTVQATPPDSTVKWANSKVEYRPGIEVEPGRYDLVVTHEGYKPARRTVVVSNTDVTLDVALDVIKYKLTVQAVPMGSTVKLANSKVEYRPGIELEPGRYELVVTHEGYKPARQQVTISNGNITFPITLEPETYKLTVQATPPDSTVKFDKIKLDYWPGMELAPGRYELVVTHEGYKPGRRTVVVSNADVTLDVALDMAKYKLTVQATPSDSTVKFDNSKVEYRPGVELVPGSYDLVVTRKGYKPARQQVTVSNGDVTFPITLEPETYKLTVQTTPPDSTVKLANSKVEYRPGVELAPGRYELVVTHEGYKPGRRTVVVSNADVALDVALDVIKYKLTVQATPPDSTVKFDNSTLDYRPGIEIEPGRYEIVVTRNGYKAARRWVPVRDADVTLDVALDPEKYKLTVRAEPADSYIKLANAAEEYRPGMELALGRYEVVVTRDGYKTERRWATIYDADVTLDVVLEPEETAPVASPPSGVDTSRPIITVKQEDTPRNVGQAIARITIRGQVTDDTGVAEVTVNGRTAELSADGTFVATDVLLRVGDNAIRITALDVYGNTGEETFTIRREGATRVSDPKPRPTPRETATIELLSPEGLRAGPRETRTTLRGRVTAPDGVAEVTVNGTAALLESDGTFTAEVPLESGDNPIVVAALDMQHNVAEQTFTIYRPPGSVAPTRRIALVIGNSAYKVSPLRNPVNDATDMAEALKKLGFETMVLRDATYRQMEDSIDNFSRKLRQGGVGLFYYAGHGVQVEGNNYLIPVDARLKDAVDLKYEAVHAGWVLERMADAGNELNIIVLDACRDNAFARGWRSAQRGLAWVRAGQGSLIAYSTAPGETALDGTGHNGVYTKYLLQYITRRGTTVEELFKRVRIAVKEETKGKQVPWESSSLLGDFYFVGK